MFVFLRIQNLFQGDKDLHESVAFSSREGRFHRPSGPSYGPGDIVA